LFQLGNSGHAQDSIVQPSGKSEIIRKNKNVSTAEKSPAPRIGAKTEATIGQRSFTFERSTDAVNVALKDLVTTEAAASQAPGLQRQKVEKALQIVNQNRARAARLLIDELKKLKADDVQGHIVLLTVLQKTDPDKDVIAYLTELAKSKDIASYQHPRTSSPGKQNEKVTTPDIVTVEGAKLQQSPIRNIKVKEALPAMPTLKRPCGEENPRELIRLSALSTLYVYAEKRDKNALNAILKTLKSPSLGVKTTAVDFYYRLRKNRPYAKAEMQKQLGKDDYYLLNRY